MRWINKEIFIGNRYVSRKFFKKKGGGNSVPRAPVVKLHLCVSASKLKNMLKKC